MIDDGDVDDIDGEDSDQDETHLELKVLIHAAAAMCDGDNEAHALVRHLLHQALHTLEESADPNDTPGLTH